MQQLEHELTQTQTNLDTATHNLEEKEKALQNAVNVPSVVRFAVTLVRWPEWASALKTTHWSSPSNSRGVSWKHSSVTSFIPPWGILQSL